MSVERVAVRHPRRTISRARMEVVASRSVAFFGLLFGAQTFPVMLDQFADLKPIWFWIFAVAVYGSLLICLISSIFRRLVKSSNLLVSICWFGSMVCWPIAVTDPQAVAADRPWLWFLCTVATATAAIALPIWPAIGFLIIAPVTFGLVRLTPSAGAAGFGLAAMDTFYAILLGGAVLLIVALLRDASAEVDLAQATALTRYAKAVRHHATEVERIQVDSIVHDSVLTTLISAAKADTAPARALASRMASQTIAQLTSAEREGAGGEIEVGLNQLVDRIESTAATLSDSFNFSETGVGLGSIPIAAAEAVHSASVQAMVNSIQHAGAERKRRVEVKGIGEAGIEVHIQDDGVGFDLDSVPKERIGLRISIAERMASAGGEAIIRAAPGEGAEIVVRWPLAEGRPK
ncbi:MAG: ATP-binding protein [Homoserinimonas sp.]|nr:ATP-binding protein [Homoserinimonas sp.]MCW5945152.1 ATP-binding protein [Cryobacterium sp.]